VTARTVVGMYDAKTNFSRLVARAEAGEEIVVSRGGRPVVKIVAYTPARVQRRRGRMKGLIEIRPGFDDLPEGFAEAFGA
jgi:prevent-host-death family protein